MSKLTKLLSVFVIAGAVSAGVATLAGCGHTHEVEKHDAKAATCTEIGYSSDYYTCSAPECEGKYYSDEACKTEIDLATITIAATGHSATKHDAKAATCTEVGYSSAYYTCSGTECTGKYYSDEACTTEVTLANITVAATGHTEVYADKGDGTHGITCEKGDLTETTEAHADADNNGECDKCKVKFFAPGNFYNIYYGTETLIEIKAGGKVVFNETEYTLSAITEDETTHALSATFTDTKGNEDETDDVVYTLTKTEKGYKLSYLYYGQDMSKDMLPVPETYAESISDFAGVYSLGGEYKYSTYSGNFKLTAISVSADAKVIYTAIKVNEDGSAIEGEKAVTYIEDVSNVAVKYNKFTPSYMSFTATAANCATVEFVFGNDDTNVVTLTKTADAAPVVPADMGLTAFTQYVNADESYSLLIKEEGVFSLNDSYNTKLISGNATDGYLIITTDSNYDYVNYVLKINATDNTVDLYGADGTTKIDTLSVKQQNIPTLAVTENMASEATLNTSPLVDVFNSSYAYYKIATAGWYYFGSGDTQNLTIYTQVANHEVDVSQGVVKVYAGFTPKGIQLAAGDIIAVSAYGNYSIIAYVESTNMDDVYSPAFSGFTAEQYGTYTYEYTGWWSTETVTFEISSSGIKYNNSAVEVVAYDGTDYIIDFWGSAIKFSFNDAGNIAVEYDEVSYQDNYVAVKGGTSGGGDEGGDEETVYAVAGENTLTPNAMLYGECKITLNKVGVWTVTYGSDIEYIVAGTAMKLSGSTIEVTDTAIEITVYAKYDRNAGGYPSSVTLTLTLTSGTGEVIEEGGATESGLVVGANTISNFTNYLATETFTATEAGDYTFAFTNGYSGGVGTTVNNEMVTIASDGTGSITVTLTAGQTITITIDEPWTPPVTLTITKA